MAKSFKTVPEMVAKLKELSEAMHKLKLKDANDWNEELFAAEVINCGGCAWFAKEVAKICNLNFRGFVVLDFSKPEVFDKAKEQASNDPGAKAVRWWNYNGIHFNHVVASFVIDGNIWYYDGAFGMHPHHVFYLQHSWGFNRYGKEVGLLDISHIEPLVKTTKGWNRCFEEAYKKPVKALIKQILNPTKPRKPKAVAAIIE